MSEETDIRTQIDQIATRLAKKLNTDDASLPDLMDGMKILNGYLVAVSKGGSKQPEKSNGNGTFAELKQRLRQEASNDDGEEYAQ